MEGNILDTVPVNRGDGVFDFEMPEQKKEFVQEQILTKTTKLLLRQKYSKRYPLHYLWRMMDLKLPLSKEGYIEAKIQENEQKTLKKQIKSRKQTDKKQKTNSKKISDHLLLMQKVRDGRAKNQNKLRLLKYEKLVDYIRTNQLLMNRKIKLRYDENKTMIEGCTGFLSQTEVNQILRASGTDKPTSQTGMTALLLLIQKTERSRRIKEKLNNFWRYLWKW